MSYRCFLCGRFNKRIRNAVGLPLSTAFPPDRPDTASSLPYAPFACFNHQEGSLIKGRLEYQQVDYQMESKA